MSEEQTKDQIILNLQPFSHGGSAHMNINRIALFGRNLEEATSSSQYDRFRAALTEYIEKAHPALGRIAQQFQILQFDPKIADALKFHADELARIAQALSLNPRVPAEELQRHEVEIPKHVDQLLDAFRVMREHVFRDFQCTPIKVLRGIVERRKSTDAGKKVSFSIRLTEPDKDVVISEPEFVAVIEALIDHPTSQANDDIGRELTFAARTGIDQWLLEMHDNSLYIPLQMWRDVFSGKGLAGRANLAKVPEILGKYDGDICVKDSVEGVGTTFLLRLRMLNT
ncbi:MAG: hypothetical protein AABZ02_13460 [Bacteroidota bacterium]